MQSKIASARLLIVDDHALVRKGIEAMLESEPDLEVVGEAADGKEALELCRCLCPDLILMDVRMPEMDGLAATRAIKAEGIAAKVMMLTTYESPNYLYEAVKAGAAGYVIKDATQHEFIRAVRRALNDENPLDQELAMQLLQRLIGEDERKPESFPEPGKHPAPLPEPLTPRELEVLRLLSQGQTNRQISQKLVVSAATVKVHVEHIIGKLGVSDRTQAAVRASERGLLAFRE